MFTKYEIIKKLKEVNFQQSEYWVVSGASMVLLGVKNQTRDIDLGCTSKMADELEKKGFDVDVLSDNTRRITFSSDIEIFENWIEGDIVFVEGIPSVSLDGIIAMKEKLAREKDKIDIQMIEMFKESKYQK